MGKLTLGVFVVLLLAASGCGEQGAASDDESASLSSPTQVGNSAWLGADSGASCDSVPSATQRNSRASPKATNMKNPPLTDGDELSPEQQALAQAVRELQTIISNRDQRGSIDETQER